jgi:hypothetical protein
MTTKRDRRRAALLEPAPTPAAGETRLISFGSPRRVADRCTYLDAPAEFALCLDCAYSRGARGSGILCAHRFGIDPTIVDGIPTQLDGDSIRRLDDEVPPFGKRQP